MEGDRDVVNEGKDSDKTEFSLSECGDMDRQLAQVASTKFGDVPVGLLDEIFQCVYFSDLLGYRRVCNGWKAVISRNGAPFLRSVIISTDNFRRSIFGTVEDGTHRFWSFAHDATTLVVCGKTGDSDSWKSDWKDPIPLLWDSYTTESRNHGRHLGVNKVVYANMTVYSNVFRHPAVLQVGFETMLYRSTLQIPVADILRHDANDSRFQKLFVPNYIRVKITDLGGQDSYILSAADAEEMAKQQMSRTAKSNNPVAECFARKHCTHLEDEQLDFIVRGEIFSQTGPVEAVRDFVEHLINRLDAGNKEALSIFDKCHLTGFAKATHPLVSFLLYSAVKSAATGPMRRRLTVNFLVSDDDDYFWNHHD